MTSPWSSSILAASAADSSSRHEPGSPRRKKSTTVSGACGSRARARPRAGDRRRRARPKPVGVLRKRRADLPDLGSGEPELLGHVRPQEGFPSRRAHRHRSVARAGKRGDRVGEDRVTALGKGGGERRLPHPRVPADHHRVATDRHRHGAERDLTAQDRRRCRHRSIEEAAEIRVGGARCPLHERGALGAARKRPTVGRRRRIVWGDASTTGPRRSASANREGTGSSHSAGTPHSASISGVGRSTPGIVTRGSGRPPT
jgi:hypothetical protein